MIELLTILIPTKNRHKLLYRSLLYYVKANINCKIIVADSSDTNQQEKTEYVCKQFAKKIDIYYIKFSPNIEPYNKNYKALSDVRTPYVLPIGDDDFPLKSSIELILSKLENNETVVAAFGERVAVKQINEKSTSHSKWVHTYTNYSGISITDVSPLDRIKKLPIPNWQQYPNAIYRTNVFKKACKVVSKFKHTQYAEFFYYCMILSSGSWMKYDVLFAVCHQESKFCKFKDRYLFPSYIGSGGSVLNGISQDSWSIVVSSLCNTVASELVSGRPDKIDSMSIEIRRVYYSKLINYIEYNDKLSNNLIDSDSFILRGINNLVIKIGKVYWKIVLHNRSGGIYEFIKFLFNLSREIINGRLIKLLLKSLTSTNTKGLLTSIKRTGSLNYESEILLHTSSRYYKEYKIIFDIWANDPCPHRLK